MIDDTPVEASFDDTSNTLGDTPHPSHHPTATEEEEKNPFENIPTAAAPAKSGEGEVKSSLTRSSNDILRSSSGSIRLTKRPHRPPGSAPSTSSLLTSSSATASALISSVEDSKRSSSSSSSAGSHNKTKNRKSSTASTDSSSSSNGSSTTAAATTHSDSSESHTSSFKTSSRALAHKLTAAENESDAALDFGPSDAPHKEPKKIVRARANIWGAKIEKAAGLNRCGCQAYKVIVQDEVRLSMWALLLLAGLVAVGFFIAKSVTGRSILFFYNGYAHTVAATVAGVFSALACLLTFLQVQAHRRHWVHPASQKHVVRILFMVPVYAISAWLSLAFVKLSAYIDFIRNCYEAYVIWSFMLLLTEYLGGHTGVAGMMRIKLKQKWPFPMCCMPRAKPDSRFLWYLKYGALQYVIFSPIFAALTIILAGIDSPDAATAPTNTTNSTSTEEDVKYCTDYYCDGEFRYDRGYGYITFMQNATQLLSLYTLAWLYLLMRQELKPYKPVPKFLVVKAVVFFTFWQGVALAAAVKMGLLHATTNFDVGELQVGVQDFLVCIEMFIAAAVHKYTFGYETYVDGTFAILMEQRRKGDSLNIPSGARLRIINETSEGKSIWEPRTTKLTIEEEEPQVLTLIVEEPEGVPPALFDDDQWNEIDATAGVDAPPDDEDNNGGAHLPQHSVSPMSRRVELEMMTTRPSPKDLDHSEQGVDTLMDLVEE